MINYYKIKKLIFKLILIIITIVFFVLLRMKIYATEFSNNEEMFTEKTIELNDGYYYTLKFKKKYINNRFYGGYEDLRVEEFVVLNDDPMKAPFSIKARWLGFQYFTCSYNQKGSSIFYIIDLNDKRLIREYYKTTSDEVRYNLFDENGKTVKSSVKTCTFIDEMKKYLLIGDRFDTKIYDLDFNVLKTFYQEYNFWLTLNCNEPYGELYYLGYKDEIFNFKSGGVILDSGMNIVYDNLSFEAHRINNKYLTILEEKINAISYPYLINYSKDVTYDYILLSKSVPFVKYKNGRSASETFIIDLNLNKVFTINKKLISETEYFIDDKLMVLLIFDDIYYMLDNEMNIIETGNPNDNNFKNKKEMNDFNSKFHYEFKFG